MFSQNIQVISILNEEESDELEALHMLYQLKKKRKRSTTHQMYKNRAEEGAYNILVLKHLIDSDTLFKEYFRLTPLLFDNVLSFIKIDLELTPVRHYQTISPEEQLCITLRLVVCIFMCRQYIFINEMVASSVYQNIFYLDSIEYYIHDDRII